MLASPLVFNNAFQMADTNFGRFHEMRSSSEVPLRTGQSTNFRLGIISHYDHENIQENTSSTDQSSVADSTVATTVSDIVRNQNQGSNCRVAIETASANECTREKPLTISRRDPFRKRICLRKASTRTEALYIYPCSCSEISKDHNDHFDEAVFRLKENVFHASNISSSLKKDMLYQILKVGSSPQKAHSAVVAVCEEEIYDQVKNVLYEPRLLRDCNLYNPTTNQRTLLSWFKKSSEPDPHRPYMPLYIYAGKPVTSLHQTLNTTSANTLHDITTGTETTYEFTLCGAKVTTADRSGSATIACVLKLDDNWYGLTAAHTFREDCTNNSLGSNNQSWASVETKCFVSPGGDVQPMESNIYLPSLSLFNASTVDLDWGLIGLTDNHLIKENAYISRGSFHNHLTVTELVEGHPQSERNVLILSSALTPLSGVLLDEYTYRTTIGEGIAQLWSVEIDEGQELVKGHSGSLVVDAATGEAYGYIVALDIFGKAQVVPLYSILEQIRNLTTIKDIVLADRANVQQMQTPSQSSTHFPGRPSPSKYKADQSDPSSSANEHQHHETERIFDSVRQETLDNTFDVMQLDDRHVVERLLKIQHCLQGKQAQIDKTDLKFLLDLTKSMRDRFSIRDHKDQQQMNKRPNAGILFEQADASLDEESDQSKSNDTKRHKTISMQNLKEYCESITKAPSTSEQNSVHDVEITGIRKGAYGSTEEPVTADLEKSADASSDKLLKQWLTLRPDIKERKSPKNNESISKWAEEIPDINEKPSLFWDMERSINSDYNKSDDSQASYFNSDDEYYHKHQDDGTSITSYQPTSAGSSHPLSPRYMYSWGTTIEPSASMGTATLELPTTMEATVVRTCRICGKLFHGGEQNLSSKMLRHTREQHPIV